MYLYRATKDPYLLELAVDILESIEHNAKTKCGYATVSRPDAFMEDEHDERLQFCLELIILCQLCQYVFMIWP